ncbi:hypothetical protein [Nostoc sp. WHI]|uniref:hypothetical protein n=1 Tax=Nostoc sp. WHI TaxID=2650611 RepID=UPI0018C64719|nr:hypothetical protein [Nostoc sp. WHI]
MSNVKFGEIVETVWSDNPAITSLDVDSCLSGFGRDYNPLRARVLHLLIRP